MQTCYETDNDKLYIQIKNKLFIVLTNSLQVPPTSTKIDTGCCGFHGTYIEYDINKMFSKFD